jgi:hypothetical protein
LSTAKLPTCDGAGGFDKVQLDAGSCTSNTVYGEVTAGGSFAVDNGNMSAAVGPFAVDAHVFPLQNPSPDSTSVRIHNPAITGIVDVGVLDSEGDEGVIHVGFIVRRCAYDPSESRTPTSTIPVIAGI